MTPIRPKFSNPPLVERALTVVFKSIALSLGDYGLFWSTVRAEFPRSESAAPIPPEIETFEGFRPSQTKIELLEASALPRALFRSPDTGELIQLQPDRFSFNWIKTGAEHTYPHSEKVMERFFALLGKFSSYVQDRELGEIEHVQCEITNVNVIPLSDVGDSFVDFGTIVKLPDLAERQALLRLESQISGAKHLIIGDDGEPIGRVHSIGQPTLRASTNELVYRLDITARGAPLGPGVGGIERFFEKAVSAVNGVFLASVTQSGRQFWGEIDG